MLKLSLIVGTFISSTVLVYLYKNYALAKGLVDKPNERSSHSTDTPSGGGLIFISLWLFGIVLLYFLGLLSLQLLLILAPGSLLIAVIGFLDDRYDISPLRRITVHFIAACIAIYLIGPLGTVTFLNFELIDIATTIVAILFIVWSTNLFNFMDGTDGLAATEGIFVFCVGGILIFDNGGTELAFSAWLLCAAIFGFLIWNWPKAKIFMGDTGSGCLGFLVAVLMLTSYKLYDLSIVPWLLLYSLFLFDSGFTLTRRILKGEKWYSAHKTHLYQRLHHVRGWSHNQVLISAITINLFIVTAIFLTFQSSKTFFYTSIVIFFLLSFVFYFMETRHGK